MKKEIVLSALLLASVSSSAGTVVCNRLSCEEAHIYDSQDILNALAQVLSKGKKEFVFCAADERTKKCFDRPISFLGRTNLMAVEFQIPFARIYQMQLEQNAIQLLLDYQVQTNRYYPVCSSSNSLLSFSVSGQADLSLDSSEFACQITELGKTKMGMKFAVDYMDLEKGRLGGRYQASVQGDVLGGGSGYAILQLSEQRAIEIPRVTPEGSGDENRYVPSASPLVVVPEGVVPEGGVPEKIAPDSLLHQEEEESSWSWDGVKDGWDSFKTKFMKLLYLEPLE